MKFYLSLCIFATGRRKLCSSCNFKLNLRYSRKTVRPSVRLSNAAIIHVLVFFDTKIKQMLTNDIAFNYRDSNVGLQSIFQSKQCQLFQFGKTK